MKEHNPKIPDNRVAIAPYNFVAHPSTVIPTDNANVSHARYTGHTGEITCTLTTETPLYIRSGLTQTEFASLETTPLPEKMTTHNPNIAELIIHLQQHPKNKPQFFYTESTKQPIIPGSSLRGIIRSMVEIATSSKMAWVSQKNLIYRSVGDPTSIGKRYREQLLPEDSTQRLHFIPANHAGFMVNKNGHWFIRPAIQIQGHSFTRVWKPEFARPGTPSIPNRLAPSPFRHVSEVWYELDHLRYRNYRNVHIQYFDLREIANTSQTGLEKGFIVRSGTMNNKKSEALIFDQDNNAPLIAIPFDMVQVYRDQLSKESINLLGEKGVLQDGCPVFFLLKDGKLVFFGHSQMFRLPYDYSPSDLIPPVMNDQIDIAESIFGFVRQDEPNNARAGRVFFSNARLGSMPNKERETIIPDILASPKPTTFQHYLVQTSTEQGVLDHYAKKDALIRGHKLYWHQRPQGNGQTGKPREKINKAIKQYTCITPVPAKTTFEFKIRFENLSDVELGALLWVLNLATRDGKHRFKLGMGKPLGFGSIAIDYSDTIFIDDRVARYRQLFNQDGSWAQPIKDANALKTTALDAFTQLMGDHLTSTRMQEFFAMLEWRNEQTLTFNGFSGHPNPDSAVRYMEIERSTANSFLDGGRERNRKINEYATRRVLPSPLQVANVPRSQNNNRQSIGERSPTVNHRDPQNTSETSTQTSQPTFKQKRELQVGDVFTGLVVDVSEKGVIVAIPNISQKSQLAVIASDKLQGKRYIANKDTARVEVIKVRNGKDGLIIYDVMPASRKGA